MARRISPIDSELGQRLRHARWTNGLSQEGLGKKLNISFQQSFFPAVNPPRTGRA